MFPSFWQCWTSNSGLNSWELRTAFSSLISELLRDGQHHHCGHVDPWICALRLWHPYEQRKDTLTCGVKPHARGPGKADNSPKITTAVSTRHSLAILTNLTDPRPGKIKNVAVRVSVCVSVCLSVCRMFVFVQIYCMTEIETHLD